MARTTSTTKQSDILARMTELGQEALNKLSDVPGGSKVVDMMNESKARLDEMQKLRGLDALEKRVAALEKQVAARRSRRRPRQAGGAEARDAEEAARLGGNAQPQRARDDLEAHRRRARLLAVELDGLRRVGVDRHDRPAEQLRLRMRQMRPR